MLLVPVHLDAEGGQLRVRGRGERTVCGAVRLLGPVEDQQTPSEEDGPRMGGRGRKTPRGAAWGTGPPRASQSLISWTIVTQVCGRDPCNLN
jgi:hypothetical protein